ncbi:hypothetical protein [Hymenobacter sp. GOD-10R]|uniref:hypothetical protein n=1 Tax=Hymenobacter sp. GOD-10R TaxID=3093922 RepID=UPI002D765E2D|nr:hypothetical protein [Hymenobacter sp. GOD-10R]WRQ31149.1 hypothetical protein SD425_12855 [Hymenobacter sp. GOD-10R]
MQCFSLFRNRPRWGLPLPHLRTQFRSRVLVVGLPARAPSGTVASPGRTLADKHLASPLQESTLLFDGTGAHRALAKQGYQVTRYDQCETNPSTYPLAAGLLNRPKRLAPRKNRQPVRLAYPLDDRACDIGGLPDALVFSPANVAGILLGGLIGRKRTGQYPGCRFRQPSTAGA